MSSQFLIVPPGFRWVRFFHRALGFAKMPAVYEKRQKEQMVAKCTEAYKREKDRSKACEYLELQKDTPWQQIFARWSQVCATLLQPWRPFYSVFESGCAVAV